MKDPPRNEAKTPHQTRDAPHSSPASWTQNDEDRDVLVQALLNPPEPSAHRKDAVKRYKEGAATEDP
jgi:hypothetical protein